MAVNVSKISEVILFAADLDPSSSMPPTTPKFTSKGFLVHLPLQFSPQPLHLTITQLLPSTTLLIHVTTSRSPRLSDALVLSMLDRTY
jgi:hypothetical protein